MKVRRSLRLVDVLAAVSGFVGVAGCLLPPSLSVVSQQSHQDGGPCGNDVGVSPFKSDQATHILIADFYGLAPNERQFAETVSRQVDLQMTRFQEEDLPKMPVHVPAESVEFRRLHCFVENHAEAERVAAALNADLVIWGRAYCNVTPEVQQSISINQEVHARDIGGAENRVGTVQVESPKPFAVCPSATLHRAGATLRRSAKALDIGSLAHLDLPTLASTQPFQLVNFTLGLHFYERGQPWIAARFFEKSVDDVLSSEDEHLSTLYGYLGSAFLELPGGAEKAIEYNRVALARLSEAPADAILEALLLVNIGRALADQSKYAEAKDYFERALQIDEKNFGPDHWLVAADLERLAWLLKKTDRPNEAEQLMRRVLRIYEKSLAPEHPAVVAALAHLALLLQDTNRLSEAEPLMRRVLRIDEQSLGPDHPDVAASLNNLAHLLRVTNRFSEAEPLMRRALRIYEQSFGPDHPNVATALMNLERLLHDTNRFSEAEPLMRRALRIYEQSFGPDHPNVAAALNYLAQLLRVTNRLSEAEPLMRRALRIDEQSLGPDHREVAEVLDNLAQLLRHTHRLGEAKRLMRRALRIDEQSLGPNDPNVARDLDHLALVLQDVNQFSEAEALMRRALRIDEQSLGPEHPNVATALNYLARLLQATNRRSEAEPLMRRALRIYEQSFGPDWRRSSRSAAARSW